MLSFLIKAYHNTVIPTGTFVLCAFFSFRETYRVTEKIEETLHKSLSQARKIKNFDL